MLRERLPGTKIPLPAPAPSAAALLLGWYDLHARVLPWRARPGEPSDPYAVWLSEIMLQQTTVAAVKAYYVRFLARWPTVQALADAPLEAVMQAWAGLGYYSRARNLHACATFVARQLGGQFPSTAAALQKLPGIGPYTAAAIAAIAFGEAASVVDANVERVITRLFAIETLLPAAKPTIQALAQTLTPQQRPGDFAQAMMDLGATLCTPRRPDCLLCPLGQACAARARGDASSFPRKLAKVPRPQRFGAAFFIRDGAAQVLVRTRAPRGLLGGMTELPGSDWGDTDSGLAALAAAPLPTQYHLAHTGVVHVFTHFALTLKVYTSRVAAGTAAPPGHRWVAEDRLDDEALPTLMRKAVAAAQGRKTQRRVA